MLTYEQALKRILGATPAPRMAMVSLRESLGLVLARPMTARCALPQFDNSAVDGYAVRLPAAPAAQAGAQDAPQQTNGHAACAALRIIGTAEAGRPFGAPVRQGEAVRILTGAQVPQGADAVVMQEHVVRRGRRLIVQRRPTPGQHIRRRGEDLRQGTRMLKASTSLRPQDIGLLAAAGVARVPVYARPTVAILTTGNELQSPGVRLTPGHIYESNGPLLHALVQQAGARAVDLGTACDAIAPLTRKVRQGLACDLLVIAGGVSVGDKDVVRQAARRCGVRQLFWQVNIKPGMPLFVGAHRPACRAGRRQTGGAGRRTLVFGLPGNPVSVFVTFEEFVKPALYRLMGRTWQDPYQEPAVLADDLRVSQTRRTHFVRVRCSQHNQLVAEPLDGQGSHRLRSLVEADGWIRVVSSEGPWSTGSRTFVKRESTRW